MQEVLASPDRGAAVGFIDFFVARQPPQHASGLSTLSLLGGSRDLRTEVDAQNFT
jgi:hypothetical protein